MIAVNLAGIFQLIITALGGYLFLHYLEYKKNFFLAVTAVVLTPFLGILVEWIFLQKDFLPGDGFMLVFGLGAILRVFQSMIFKNRQPENGGPANESAK